MYSIDGLVEWALDRRTNCNIWTVCVEMYHIYHNWKEENGYLTSQCRLLYFLFLEQLSESGLMSTDEQIYLKYSDQQAAIARTEC